MVGVCDRMAPGSQERWRALLDPLERCLDLQYRFAALVLGGCALASGVGGLAQLRLSAS